MQTSYRRLVNANPKARLSVAHFLEQGQRNSGFFSTPLIKLADSIDNLGMKTEAEREAFLNDLDKLSDDFPEDYFKMKILPELLKSVEFGGGGPDVLAAIMKIGAKLTDDEFESRITPVVVRLFNSPDRAIRVSLLDNLPVMIDRLPQKVVNDKIFPQMVSSRVPIRELRLTFVGHWLYRRRARGSRANCEGRAYNHYETLRQDNKRGVVEVLGQDFK